MAKFEPIEGEKELGDWIINYRPPGGGRFTGDLRVTDRRLLFDAKFNTSILGTFKELFIVSGSHQYLSIPKDSIASAVMQKKFLSKRVVVTLENSQQHVFDYGLFSVKRLHAAINER